jgi:hypothetical protein
MPFNEVTKNLFVHCIFAFTAGFKIFIIIIVVIHWLISGSFGFLGGLGKINAFTTRTSAPLDDV